MSTSSKNTSKHLKINFKFNDTPLVVDVLIKENDLKKINRSSRLIKSNKKSSSITLCDDFFNDEVKNKIRFILVYKDFKWVIKKPNEDVSAKFEFEISDIDLKQSENNIFFILESPHRDEYSPDDKMTPKVPANGKTGENLNEYFTSHVLPILIGFGLKLDIKKEYNFCLINPVPYQASLGNLYPKGLISNIRDGMWKTLYKYTRVKFENLFNIYKPIIVINACTTEFKDSVQESINKKTSTTMKFTTTHPSSWHIYFSNFQKYDHN